MPDLSKETEPLIHLAGAMAHELNNIFTAVAGNLSLLDHEIAGVEEQAEIVQDVIRAAERGIVLTAKLQAFAGRQALQMKMIDLNETVVRALNRSRLTKEVSLQMHLARAKVVVLGDEEKLSHVIEELVSNACTAMPSSGGRIVVETEIFSEGAWPHTRLRIRDNGCGMAPEVVRHAAEPLFTTARQHGVNKGWGLSNCTGIIRQLRGRITLSSEPNCGTLVEILLPLGQNG
jgi:signal transduction histidine kinase